MSRATARPIIGDRVFSVEQLLDGGFALRGLVVRSVGRSRLDVRADDDHGKPTHGKIGVAVFPSAAAALRGFVQHRELLLDSARQEADAHQAAIDWALDRLADDESPIPAGTSVEYVATTIGGNPRVRFGDGTTAIMPWQCFASLRKNSTP